MPPVPLSLSPLCASPLGPLKTERAMRELGQQGQPKRDEENAELSPGDRIFPWDPVSWSPGRWQPQLTPKATTWSLPHEGHVLPRVNFTFPEDSIYTAQ